MASALSASAAAERKLHLLLLQWPREQGKSEENQFNDTAATNATRKEQNKDEKAKKPQETEFNEQELECNQKEFLVWFLQQFAAETKKEDNAMPIATAAPECTLEDFAVYFLNGVRRQAESHLQLQLTAAAAMSGTIPPAGRQQPCSTPRQGRNGSNSSHNTNHHDDSHAMATPKTPLSGRLASSADRISFSQSLQNHSTSTPRTPSHHQQQQQNQSGRRSFQHASGGHTPGTPIGRTPPSQHRNSGGGGGNGSLCFADFLGGTPTFTQRGGGQKKRTPQQQQLFNETPSPTTTTTTRAQNTSANKPKKRVVPTTIASLCHSPVASGGGGLRSHQHEKSVEFDGGKNRSFGGDGESPAAGHGGRKRAPFGSSSSFCNENNILSITSAELDDDSQCAIREARQTLRLRAGEIAKQMAPTTTTPTKAGSHQVVTTTNGGEVSVGPHEVVDLSAAGGGVGGGTPPFEFSLMLVTSRRIMNTLARIYDALMEANLVTNVLSEVSFLMNLLNAVASTSGGAAKCDGSLLDGPATIREETAISAMTAKSPLEAVSHLANGIYLALCVLCLQRRTLAQLDAKSLGVLLHSERLTTLAPTITTNLVAMQRRKQQQEREEANRRGLPLTGRQQQPSDAADRSLRSVHYQAEHDARQNFPTQAAFGAYKTQRDLFYTALKTWQTHHLRPAWQFANELGPCIDELLRQSEHPVNMGHFARLFVSQLLIAASDAIATSAENGSSDGLPEEFGDLLDEQKLNRLMQRLVAPSSFSADFQFPRQQAFFRDFIQRAAVRSAAFAEQLKLALFLQLQTLNESKYEQYNLRREGVGWRGLSEDDDDDDDVVRETDEVVTPAGGAVVPPQVGEWAVRPDTLASLLTLAKFLGYVIALPYMVVSPAAAGASMRSVDSDANNGQLTGLLEQRQLTLRRLFQPQFQLEPLLRTAFATGRLLITLPWLVQYLAMLDNVSLQLNDSVATTQLMCCIYARLNCGDTAAGMSSITFVDVESKDCEGFSTGGGGGQQQLPTAAFILRCCIGWLFEERPLLAQQYFSYRNATRTILRSPAVASDKCQKKISCEVEPSALQTLLSVACPFLAEFRLAIMPAKWAQRKDVSRSGRYRYITLSSVGPHRDKATSEAVKSVFNTPLRQGADAGGAPAAPPVLTVEQQQAKLRDAFLHSQPASMRRLLEFVAERVYKATIKDVQLQLLAPLKSAADGQVNGLASIDYHTIFDAVKRIYNDARQQALTVWDAQVSGMLNQRIDGALEALLPADTVAVIRRTYAQLIGRQTGERISQWRYANIQKDNAYFCCSGGGGGVDTHDGGQNAYVHDIAKKICKANVTKASSSSSKATKQSSELRLVSEEPSVSELLVELQRWLHLTSAYAATSASASSHAARFVSEPKLLDFLLRLPAAFVNVLPTVFYRLVGSSLVYLLQHLILRHRDLLQSGEVVAAALSIWLATPMQQEHDDEVVDEQAQASQSEGAALDGGGLTTTAGQIVTMKPCNIFDSLVTVGFVIQCDTDHLAFVELTKLLIALVLGGALTVDDVNRLFMRLFKESWSSEVLNEMSLLLSTVADERRTSTRRRGGQGEGSVLQQQQQPEEEAKSHLLMEALADFVRDVDDF